MCVKLRNFFFTSLVVVSFFLALQAGGCVMGATGRCKVDRDCNKYGPIRLYCARGWCVPKEILEWTKKQDAKKKDAGEPTPPIQDTPSQDEIADTSCHACQPNQTINCFPSDQKGCDVSSKSCKGICSLGTQKCVKAATGCYQWGSCEGAIRPTKEVCDDGKDNDCNGQVDEGCAACRVGKTEACYTSGTGCSKATGSFQCKGQCKIGQKTCDAKGKWGLCTGETGPGSEVCKDGRDNNCDGIIDNFCVTTFAGEAGSSGQDDHPNDPTQARFSSPHAIAYDAKALFITDANNKLRKIDLGSGKVSTIPEMFNSPKGLAFNQAGELFIADTMNHVIKKLASFGAISTFAGSSASSGSTDGIGTSAQFDSPQGLAFDANGNLYVADTNNHTIRKITPSGEVSTFAGKAGEAKFVNDPDPKKARFFSPTAIAHHAGILYIADTGNNQIRKINIKSGNVTTLPGNYKAPQGLAVDRAGDLFIADTGNHVIKKLRIAFNQSKIFVGKSGTSGSDDGAIASSANTTNNLAASFHSPKGLVFDQEGNLYVTDTNNHTIRKIILK